MTDELLVQKSRVRGADIMDDAACFTALRVGTEAQRDLAFTTLYARYAPRFLGRLRKWRLDKAACEDCVANIFAKLWQQNHIQPISNPRAYLWKMLHSEAVTEWRRRRPVSVASALGEDWSFENLLDSQQMQDNAATPVEYEECVDRAWEAFAKRAPGKAHALQLLGFDGLSIEEIAEAFGKKAGAMREYLSQARKLFHGILSELCPGLIGPATNIG
jgi:RNA polymerase sigma factor (sigma-70 family)